MKQQHLLLMVSLLVGWAAAWCGPQLPRPSLSSPQRRSRTSLLPLAASSWQGEGYITVATDAGGSTSSGGGGSDVRPPLNGIPDATFSGLLELEHSLELSSGAVLSKLEKMEETIDKRMDRLEKLMEKMQRTLETGLKEIKEGIFYLQILVAVLFIVTVLL